ncbi:hypothetical protein GCM10008939_00060 [Deinococcus aquiradiocola]|uniref:Uncharacterized protein n=1 Tax=Deinococcus aquiradiocola TaxID=393059 RepID=A0A917LDJ8_9DEIO|nr:hypothetical protein GCM10008939_00060 [Deinococcus aquiradiocola]
MNAAPHARTHEGTNALPAGLQTPRGHPLRAGWDKPPRPPPYTDRMTRVTLSSPHAPTRTPHGGRR